MPKRKLSFEKNCKCEIHDQVLNLYEKTVTRLYDIRTNNDYSRVALRFLRDEKKLIDEKAEYVCEKILMEREQGSSKSNSNVRSDVVDTGTDEVELFELLDSVIDRLKSFDSS